MSLWVTLSLQEPNGSKHFFCMNTWLSHCCKIREVLQLLRNKKNPQAMGKKEIFRDFYAFLRKPLTWQVENQDPSYILIWMISKKE